VPFPPLEAVAELEARVTEAERNASECKATVNAAHAEKAEATQVFRQERAILEGKIYTLERDYAVALQKATDLESEVQSMKDTLQMHIETTVTSGGMDKLKKVAFDDTADMQLNALNVPTQDYAHLSKQRQCLSTVATMITDFVSHVSNLYTYLDQRIENMVKMGVYGINSGRLALDFRGCSVLTLFFQKNCEPLF
jgi:chromosome segregation ATPase